jgi:hypothetical protein
MFLPQASNDFSQIYLQYIEDTFKLSYVIVISREAVDVIDHHGGAVK